MRHKMLAMSMWLAAALPSPAGAALTAEEVIQRHLDAQGGVERWKAVDSMQVTGTFQSFSTVAPFSLSRKKSDRYYLDHSMNGRRVIIGYDGNVAWWDNGWLQPGAQRIDGADLAVALRDADFVSPFFQYQERGWKMKLIGETEIEGIPAIGLELTRDDGQSETWYLDPKTYLAVARVSPGSDFGNPMPQRTFFDDFREVGGLVLPYYSETQWYTRDRVMVVENVEMNVPVDDAIFEMPPPPGMGPLRPMTGSWKVAFARRPQPGADWQESERESKIESLVGGTMLQETYVGDGGVEVIRTLSYDRFREKYRMTSITGDTGLMDVQEGRFDEGGRLTVTNLETGTSDNRFGLVILGRMGFFDISADGFSIEYEVSIDGGETWFLAARGTYTRSDG